MSGHSRPLSPAGAAADLPEAHAESDKLAKAEESLAVFARLLHLLREIEKRSATARGTKAPPIDTEAIP